MSANTEESIDDRVAQLITQPLHPELFKPSGAVTQGQVLSAFGNVTVGLHIDVIAALVEKVQGIKTDVRSWGLHQVRAKIVKNFNQCSPGGSFCTIGQVADYWKVMGQSRQLENFGMLVMGHSMTNQGGMCSWNKCTWKCVSTHTE
jgi:hypothetical protein